MERASEVRSAQADSRTCRTRPSCAIRSSTKTSSRRSSGPDEGLTFIDDPTTEFRAIRGTIRRDSRRGHLRAKGIDAQPDHVLFAHGMACCCCGPHPATGSIQPSSPIRSMPTRSTPTRFTPTRSTPTRSTPTRSTPTRRIANGPTRSSARPADPPEWYSRAAPTTASVGSCDGIAAGRRARHRSGHGRSPRVLRVIALDVTKAGYQRRSTLRMSNHDRWLDPVAGHGTFIAGIIERIAPGCAVEIRRVLGPQGDGIESEIVAAIDEIALATRSRPTS